MSLDIHPTIMGLETLVKTETAQLEGERVVGIFARSHRLVIVDVARTCEAFANCPESGAGILSFTRRYAPLRVIAAPGEPFDFALSEWRQSRKRFQWQWKQSTPTELQKHSELEGLDLKNLGRMVALEGGNFLRFSRRGVVLQAEQLSTLIDVCFAAIPVDRRRFCPAPGCKRPYFVAHHLKQTFCGNKECIDWGKRKLKLEYWERNKRRLLAERKQKREGAINVTRKAR
ncbi:MAG: hypothetical protein ABSF59_22015 [Candidatus Sulfotelmatobacter sp.]|jgi:ribosomal protein S27AE